MTLKENEIVVFRIYKGFQDRNQDSRRKPKQIVKQCGELQILLDALPKAHWVELDKTIYRGFSTEFNGNPRRMIYQIDVHAPYGVGKNRRYWLTVWRPHSAFEVYFARKKDMYGWIDLYTKGETK